MSRAMKVRLERSQGNTAAFDLVLIDGFEDGEWPTHVQVEDSSEQVSLARDLGCLFEDADDRPFPHPEGVHGIAYDFLSVHVMAGTVFPAPEGYFDTFPYGPYRTCIHCNGFHRLGYGGECVVSGQRFLWDGSRGRMVEAAVAKQWARIEVLVDFPCLVSSEDAFEDWLRALDTLQTPRGVRALYSTLKSVHDRDPHEGLEVGVVAGG
jgi:hypothetical protein